MTEIFERHYAFQFLRYNTETELAIHDHDDVHEIETVDTDVLSESCFGFNEGFVNLKIRNQKIFYFLINFFSFLFNLYS